MFDVSKDFYTNKLFFSMGYALLHGVLTCTEHVDRAVLWYFSGYGKPAVLGERRA